MPENEEDRPPNEADSQPAEIFALVGHEIRAEIIQVLWPGVEVSLSDLRSRLDHNIEPSQLHYHLKQLVGHFIEATDEGYRLNSVGRLLRMTLHAGEFDRRKEKMKVPANFDCYDCQATVEVIFDDGQVQIMCTECKQRYMLDYYYFPLDLFESQAEVYEHFKHYQTLKMIFLARGVCFYCANKLDPMVRDTRGCSRLEEHEKLKVVIDLGCGHCGAGWWQSVGMAVRADPGLISFCYQHGLDVLSTPHWELEFAMTDNYVTIRSMDPLEVALEVTLEHETLELVIDGELNVVERNRYSAGDVDRVSLPAKSVCFEYVRRHRWPNSVRCPRCDGTDVVKMGTTCKNAQRYKCKICESIFNDLTGTIFARHRFTLPEMFHIIRKMDDCPSGKIGRQIGRTAESVAQFTRKVREARQEFPECDLLHLAKTGPPA